MSNIICHISFPLHLSSTPRCKSASIQFARESSVRLSITVFGWYEYQRLTFVFLLRLPVLKILPLCVLFAGFLLLGNWSLQLNNIEFYSLAKMMTCPTIVLLNFVLFRKTVSRMVFLSIGLLTGGVMLANHKFGVAHPFGAGVAVMAFSVTAAYQIWIQKKIGDLHVSPSQLLLNQAPVAVLLLLFVAPFTDRVPDICTVSSVALGKPARCQIGQDANLIHAAHVKPETWFALLASGVVASLINVSQFLIIGATSALTVRAPGSNFIGSTDMSTLVQRRWHCQGRQCPSDWLGRGEIMAFIRGRCRRHGCSRGSLAVRLCLCCCFCSGQVGGQGTAVRGSRRIRH